LLNSDIDASGGLGVTQGGHGGDVALTTTAATLYNQTISGEGGNFGYSNINVSGGDADFFSQNATFGGDGGSIVLTSEYFGATVRSLTLNASGGNGSIGGTDGAGNTVIVQTLGTGDLTIGEVTAPGGGIVVSSQAAIVKAVGTPWQVGAKNLEIDLRAATGIGSQGNEILIFKDNGVAASLSFNNTTSGDVAVKTIDEALVVRQGTNSGGGIYLSSSGANGSVVLEGNGLGGNSLTTTGGDININTNAVRTPVDVQATVNAGSGNVTIYGGGNANQAMGVRIGATTAAGGSAGIYGGTVSVDGIGYMGAQLAIYLDGPYGASIGGGGQTGSITLTGDWMHANGGQAHIETTGAIKLQRQSAGTLNVGDFGGLEQSMLNAITPSTASVLDIGDATHDTNVVGSVGAGNTPLIVRGDTVTIATGGSLASTASGSAINVVTANGFTVTDATSLSTPSGNWFVWAPDPSTVSMGLQDYDFGQYNANYASPPTPGQTGNGLMYSYAPVLTPSITVAARDYDGTAIANSALSLSSTGYGDFVSLTVGTALYDDLGDKNAGTGKHVSQSVAINLPGSYDANSKPIYGVALSSSAATYGGAVINKAHLTVTADDQSRLYGQSNPVFTETITGFVPLEDLSTSGVTGSATGSSTATSATNVIAGPQIITANVGTLTADNYDFTPVDGTLTITPATVSLSASKVYDGTLDLNGFVTIATGVNVGAGVETLTYTGATTNDSHVLTASKYIDAITIANGSNGGLASNYQLPLLNNANAPVTITAAPLTSTASIGGTLTKTHDGTTAATGATIASGTVLGAVAR
ncbi:MAG: hypothetical protein IPO38_11285, partial [Rhodocyclaceae bacterium]|nr:hypothetical protein [Rhodocyclaceae bacterium]